MADDHNALLARADTLNTYAGPTETRRLIADLAAELRALTSRHEAALDILAREVTGEEHYVTCPYYLTVSRKDVSTESCNQGCYDEPACSTSRWSAPCSPHTAAEAEVMVIAAERAVLDQAKDRDHE